MTAPPAPDRRRLLMALGLGGIGLMSSRALAETPPRPVTTSSAAPSTPAASRIGIVGAGQLARMLLGPAIELGLTTTVLATDPAESAALVRQQAIVDGRNVLDPGQWRAAGWTYRALGRP